MRRLDPWMLAPGLALAAGAGFVASEAPGTGRLLDLSLAVVGVLLAWGTATVVRSRDPDRPLWILLCAVAITHAMQPLVASPHPWLFTLARASRPAIEVLLMWVMLSFPTGRLPGWRERSIVGTAVAAAVLLWLPGMMFSPRVPLPGPFVTCGAACADNLLFVADRPQWAMLFLAAFRTVGAAILLLTSVQLFLRLRRTSALMRRSLAPVLLASIARALSIAAFLLTGGVIPLVLEMTFLAVIAAIAWGLLRNRLWIARALQQLVTGLRATPDRRELHQLIARALGDPSLQIGYWVPESSRWVDADGVELRVPEAGDSTRAACTITGERGEAVAVIVHDVALLEEPALVEAVASSMRVALASRQLEATLQATRLDAAQAAANERQRIERDLHDGAQQRLLALRMKLAVSKRLLDHDPQRAASLLVEMDTDIDAAIAEMRALAAGVLQPLLSERGLAAALREAASRAAIPVTLDVHEVGRTDTAAEQAVYFCCVEALQNAAKHAGAGAEARLTLQRRDGAIVFSVEDNGPGFGYGDASRAGQGLRNIRSRLAAVGGSVEWVDRDGSGCRLAGTVPGTFSG